MSRRVCIEGSALARILRQQQAQPPAPRSVLDWLRYFLATVKALC